MQFPTSITNQSEWQFFASTKNFYLAEQKVAGISVSIAHALFHSDNIRWTICDCGKS